QDVGVGAAGVLKSIGQHGEAAGLKAARGQVAVVVGGLGEGDDGWRLPGGGEVNGAERVAEDAADNDHLLLLLFVGVGVSHPPASEGVAGAGGSTGRGVEVSVRAVIGRAPRGHRGPSGLLPAQCGALSYAQVPFAYCPIRVPLCNLYGSAAPLVSEQWPN